MLLRKLYGRSLNDIRLFNARKCVCAGMYRSSSSITSIVSYTFPSLSTVAISGHNNKFHPKNFFRPVMEQQHDAPDPALVNPAVNESEEANPLPSGSESILSDSSESGSGSSGASDSGSDSGSSNSDDDSGSSGSESDSDSDSDSSESGSGDEDESEAEERISKRKRAPADASKKKRFRFLDVEADVGSGDDEEEEYMDEEAAAARLAREGGRESRELELLRREAEQRRKAGGSNRLKSVIQRLEERAAREGAAGEAGAVVPAGEDAEESSALVPDDYYEGGAGDFESALEASAALFPTPDDYKLFFVRMAEPGKEREAVIQLSHKAAEEISNGRDCQIRSIFSVDSLRGYLYIEAPNDTVAKNFLMGIRKVQWYNVILVPENEMAGVFRAALEEANQKFALLQPGQFVRIKRHNVYKGDLARVVECYDRDVDLILVPRIDWSSTSTTAQRPVPSLFNEKVIESLGVGEVERLRNPNTGRVHSHFRGEMFDDDGFLIKRFNRASLVTDPELVSPKLSELRRFVTSGKPGEESTPDASQEFSISDAKGGRSSKPAAVVPHAPIVVAVSSRREVFRIGDKVIVVSGDLKNFTGTVALVDKRTATVTIGAADGSDQVQVIDRDVEKFFKVSDHVLILSGASEGDTGVITSISKDRVHSVLIDGETREITCSANSLQVSPDISKGETQFHGYALGDLVQIRRPIETVAVVIKISKSGHFAVIGIDAKKHSVQIADIVGKKESSKTAFSVSRHGDPIRRGCVIKVISDGSTGTVTDVYRSVAFVKINGKVEDGGFSVIESTKLELIGGSNRPEATNFGNFTGGGAPSGAPTPTKTTSAPQRRGGARLEGKRVRIIKGPFKGQLAQVREDHDTRVQVSLEAKFRVVTIPKDCVRLEDEEEDDNNNQQWNNWNDKQDDSGEQQHSYGSLSQPPPGAVGSLSQPPKGYVPPSATPYTPAPPEWSNSK